MPTSNFLYYQYGHNSISVNKIVYNYVQLLYYKYREIKHLYTRIWFEQGVKNV